MNWQVRDSAKCTVEGCTRRIEIEALREKIEVLTDRLQLNDMENAALIERLANRAKNAENEMHIYKEENERLAARVPDGCVVVGYLDGRDRFFYADDPHMEIDHTGMREVFAAGEVKP